MLMLEKKKKKAKGTDSSLPLPKGNLGDTTEPGSSQRCTVKSQEVTVMSYKGKLDRWKKFLTMIKPSHRSPEALES